MLKHYRFGFDFGAALLFAAIMLPNIYWFAVPAPNDILRGASVTPTIDTIGSVFQVLMIGLLPGVRLREAPCSTVFIHKADFEW